MGLFRRVRSVRGERGGVVAWWRGAHYGSAPAPKVVTFLPKSPRELTIQGQIKGVSTRPKDSRTSTHTRSVYVVTPKQYSTPN